MKRLFGVLLVALATSGCVVVEWHGTGGTFDVDGYVYSCELVPNTSIYGCQLIKQPPPPACPFPCLPGQVR